MKDSVQFAPDQIAPVIAAAHEHGLLVLFTHSTSLSPLKYYETASRFPQDAAGRIRSPYRDWPAIAEAAAAHDPGPGANHALRLTGVQPEGEIRTLLLRAFYDVDELELHVLQQGHSGAVVWIGYARGESARKYPVPFLIKCHTIAKVREERLKFEDFVEHQLPSRNRPALHRDRFALGEEYGVLIQEFLVDAAPFESSLHSGSIASAEPLFDRALHGWVNHAHDLTGSLGQPFRDLKALNWSDALQHAGDCAAARFEEAVLPNALRAMIEAMPKVTYRACTIHGDLHVGNVFVAGSSDALVIDFARVMTGPLAADPACFEVSLVLPSRSREEVARGPLYPLVGACTQTGLTLDGLQALYEPPIAAATIGMDQGRDLWIRRAIRSIRSCADRWNAGATPYAFALGAFLIRFASYDDHAHLDDRAVAYHLATRLIQWTIANSAPVA